MLASTRTRVPPLRFLTYNYRLQTHYRCIEEININEQPPPGPSRPSREALWAETLNKDDGTGDETALQGDAIGRGLEIDVQPPASAGRAFCRTASPNLEILYARAMDYTVYTNILYI